MMRKYNLRNIMKEILDKTTGKIFTKLPLDLTHIQCITGDRVL
jgi:hypothetical protein